MAEKEGDMKRLTKLMRRRARGLATLEMVLCLPLLLFIMALMINFGTAAAWKVRTLVVARHAVWATRWPRETSDLPRPWVLYKTDTSQDPATLKTIPWPEEDASMGAGGDADITELDDSRLEHPVVRGPLPYGAAIDPDMYDLMTMSHGARRGSAAIQRELPLLAKMGPYRLSAACPLLDNDWRYQRMPWDDWYWYWGGTHNEHRRIPIIYDLGIISPESDLVESLYQEAGFRNAYFAMATGVNWNDLKPLGGQDAYGRELRDDEDVFYENHFPDFPVPPGPFGRHMGNQHPRLGSFCTLDEEQIQERVENLIDRIQGKDDRPTVPGVPERLSRSYQGLYRAAINRYNRQWPNDPRPQGNEQDDLQQKIDELDGFIGTL